MYELWVIKQIHFNIVVIKTLLGPAEEPKEPPKEKKEKKEAKAGKDKGKGKKKK